MQISKVSTPETVDELLQTALRDGYVEVIVQGRKKCLILFTDPPMETILTLADFCDGAGGKYPEGSPDRDRWWKVCRDLEALAKTQEGEFEEKPWKAKDSSTRARLRSCTASVTPEALEPQPLTAS